MIIIFLLVIIFASLILEGAVTQLPLVFVSLLLFCIFKRSYEVFPVAFISGLLLDIFSLRIPGSTVIYFLLFFLLVLLYQRKYEINSYPFVFFSAFLGSYLYLIILGDGNKFIQAGFSSVIAIIFFAALSLIAKWSYGQMANHRTI